MQVFVLCYVMVFVSVYVKNQFSLFKSVTFCNHLIHKTRVNACLITVDESNAWRYVSRKPLQPGGRQVDAAAINIRYKDIAPFILIKREFFAAYPTVGFTDTILVVYCGLCLPSLPCDVEARRKM